MGLQMCSSSSSSQHARVAAWVLLPLLCFSMVLTRAHGGESRKVYVAYLGDVKHGHPDEVVASHHDMLTTLLQSKEDASASMVYNYKHGFSGFAAMLTADQATRLAEFPGVISVERSKTYRTTTTRSWDFLGLNYPSSHTPASELLQASNYGEDIIIGVVDTGIWPESRSFSDQGYGPVPSRWKGKCQVGPDWGSNNCSRKIIGARFYTAGVPKEYFEGEPLSPRDHAGHGTHTASTAAGSAVGQEAASFHGIAAGVARGGAPHARIAVYKSCWSKEGHCPTPAVLAAIDDAIHDGVDVLSLSLEMSENSYGTLHAVLKGIVMVHTAGNAGPHMQTIRDTSPWAITVAATNIDRSFDTVITLGNKQQIVGQSLYYQGKKSSSSRSSFGDFGCLRSCTAEVFDGAQDLKGAILLCNDQREALFPAAQYLMDRGGTGLIIVSSTTDDMRPVTDCEGIACVVVNIDDAERMCQYSEDTSSAQAKIEPAGTVTGKEILAPKVAIFSSRGPSVTYPAILKPDIAAPGANILAAKQDGYVFKSGTSMAAPHVAGIAALLKVLHPYWSPAAIKSAMVTTAHVTDERGMPIMAEGISRKIADPFDYGGGTINPCGAAHPGLIYDIDPSDYSKFFKCTISNKRTPVDCNTTTMQPAYYLNLPSISVPDLRHPITVSRTVTNVGEVNSVYHAAVQSPAGVKMEVVPPVLVFDATNKVQTYQVKLSPMWKLHGYYTFGSLTWHNDQKTVRIPIVTRLTIEEFY
ncbi:subtilisin-like protease SBT3.6 isoform X1 [Aegilops tauschii subsp. strangulata]|uniref:Subtilisin-like protease n=1 Tax=Aegilops tauschii subsp. strangulata TaxID=200361 RepID=A0A452ZY20_AEGTS|nr:subtilisin-like protease SBT3.6 [Aegilops tauschii subsp. strangulata]